MIDSKDLFTAAQELGAALGDTQIANTYRQAAAALRADVSLCQIEAQADQCYFDLIRRQQAGEMVAPREVNQFYALREEWSGHPLVRHYTARQQALQQLCQQTGGILSSILSVEYTDLVK